MGRTRDTLTIVQGNLASMSYKAEQACQEESDLPKGHHRVGAWSLEVR